MAKKFKKMGGIKDTESGNFGSYKEYNGGGSPKGGIWGGQSGRVGWKNRENQGEVAQGEHRESQPRTADGKFTYNSVNGKETEYESRGETVNPLLTGGKNGVKIQDVKAQFTAKSGSLYDKYKDKWYQKGSEKIVKEGKKFKTVIANDDIWEIARRSFDIKKGGFTGEDTTFAQGKAGRPSAAENAAKAEARKAGGETFVKDPTGQIAVKAGTQPSTRWNTGKAFDIRTIFKKQAQQRVRQAALGGQVEAGSAPKPTNIAPSLDSVQANAQADRIRKFMAAKGYDTSKFTNAQLAQIGAKYLNIGNNQ